MKYEQPIKQKSYTAQAKYKCDGIGAHLNFYSGSILRGSKSPKR